MVKAGALVLHTRGRGFESLSPYNWPYSSEFRPERFRDMEEAIGSNPIGVTNK